MRKNIICQVLIAVMMCVFSQAVFAKEIISMGDLFEISSDDFEYYGQMYWKNYKTVYNTEDKEEIEEKYDLLSQLQLTKTNPNPIDEYLSFTFCVGDMYYSYYSNFGFVVQSDNSYNSYEYYINHKDFLEVKGTKSKKGLGNDVGIEMEMAYLGIPGVPETASLYDDVGKNYEIYKLKQLGIIKGDLDGGFRENDDITRAEFVAVLCRAMGREEEAQESAMKTLSSFSDVPASHWAAGYINYAYSIGAVSGYNDGKFYPEKNITNEEVIKMLISAWGYSEEAEQNGGYPNGYMKIAKENSVLNSVSFNCKQNSKRWLSSVFVYQILPVEPKNDNVKKPIRVKLVRALSPRVDTEGYVEKPEEILINVTPESAPYERILFEQEIPEEYSPIDIEGKNITNTWYRNFTISIKKEGSKIGFSKELEVGESIDTSVFENGRFNVVVGYNDGTISDFSSTYVEISEEEVLQKNLFRRCTKLADESLYTKTKSRF